MWSAVEKYKYDENLQKRTMGILYSTESAKELPFLSLYPVKSSGRRSSEFRAHEGFFVQTIVKLPRQSQGQGSNSIGTLELSPNLTQIIIRVMRHVQNVSVKPRPKPLRLLNFTPVQAALLGVRQQRRERLLGDRPAVQGGGRAGRGEPALHVGAGVRRRVAARHHSHRDAA